MDLKLQIVFIIASIGTIVFVIRQIRKYGLNIEDSITWIIWSILLLLLSLFPMLADSISRFLGFMSTSNFILSLFIFYLYIVVFMQMIQISKLKEKEKELIQRLSIDNAKTDFTDGEERK
ncbi:DUF2304 domain-containing protein [uncultured Faecalibaculum sp.]|uniref:DUF2304 domain-containing protein n=1 Tax=uncultured Faecalibaculum sp. TaxID=1729681 RepID=UPI00260959C0|nr:DUF2304 domain-containing protein [uncultured Faecalibaculum sp.]